jgi:hypothetical protein
MLPNRCKLTSYYQCRRSVAEEIISLRCSQCNTMATKVKTSDSKRKGFVSLARCSCDGVLTLRKKSSSAVFQLISCSHQLLHEKRNFTKPTPELILFIEENFSRGPSGKFKETLRTYRNCLKEIQHITRNQIYYYWSQKMKSVFQRNENEVSSTLLLFHQLPTCKPLYARSDPSSCRAICFVTDLGYDVINSAGAQEAFINSTRT